MRKINITDLIPGVVKGIEIQMPTEEPGYKEAYFEWTASLLVSKINTTEVSGGILKAWHHVPVFSEIETHIDTEMFYFVSGVALMLFVDVKNGKPDSETAQIVRIQPGTQIIIHPGKGHFVPVSDGSEPVYVVVAAPKMEAPRMLLPESVEGI